jgi:UDP-N-acetylglucosamine 2-epimerase
MSYADLLRLLKRCYLTLTDSGGIQEEAPSFHKPVLILRDVTERPEVVVESLSNYARLAAGMVKAGVNTPESLRKDARALRNVLDEVAKLPKVDAARIAEVRAEIAALTVSLGTN